MKNNKFYTFGQPVTLESKAVFEPYFNTNPLRSSSQGFASLYMWSDQRWDIVEGMLVQAGRGWFGQGYDGPFIYTPLSLDGTCDPAHLRRVILACDDALRDPDMGFRVFGVPKEHVALYDEAIGDCSERLDNRESWDYVYKRSDLEFLKGRKYSKKRNHLNYFYENVDFVYEPVRQEHAQELSLALDDFSRRKAEKGVEDELVREEIDTIKKILPEIEAIGFFGGLIRIDGDVKAFTLAYPHTQDSVEVAVEKADDSIRGLYQAINREFVASLPPEILYINREEDMGIDGLRQAKMSYHPHILQELYGYVLEDC